MRSPPLCTWCPGLVAKQVGEHQIMCELDDYFTLRLCWVVWLMFGCENDWCRCRQQVVGYLQG